MPAPLFPAQQTKALRPDIEIGIRRPALQRIAWNDALQANGPVVVLEFGLTGQLRQQDGGFGGPMVFMARSGDVPRRVPRRIAEQRIIGPTAIIDGEAV